VVHASTQFGQDLTTTRGVLLVARTTTHFAPGEAAIGWLTHFAGGGGTSDAGARADTAPGSGAESSLGSVLTEGFFVPTGQPGPQSRPHTRLQTSIHKLKLYTDGTIHYGCLAESDEPRSLDDALTNKNWKIAMDVEYDALMKNKTC
jgi:hypothetical protein